MMHLVEALKGKCSPTQMVDALILSIAVYEPTYEDVMATLQCKRDLPVPVGLLEPLPPSEGIEGCGSKQPFLVARSSHGHVVVGCRGTCGFEDVLQDLKFVHKRLPSGQGAAHLGFSERAHSISVTLFTKLLLAGECIVFTGHSLGGAVASLLALRVVLEASKAGTFSSHQVRCITFGAPLFADPYLAETINTHYKDMFYHVVSRNDCVPKILPLVSALQRVVHGPEDSLEALRIVRLGLEVAERLTRLPLASAIHCLESIIPPPVKTILRGLLKLAFPSDDGLSYHHAGHVLMVDPHSRAELTDSVHLNCWSNQIFFAFGIISQAAVNDHCMSNYYRCLERGMMITVADKSDQPSKVALDAFSVTRSETMMTSVVTSGASHMSTNSGTNFEVVRLNLASLAEESANGDVYVRCTMRVVPCSTESSPEWLPCTVGGEPIDRSSDTALQVRGGASVIRLAAYAECTVKFSKDGVPKLRWFRFGWVLRTIGRISRHLQSLDRVFMFYSLSAFIRIVL